ncbi:helix-turn-helix domain-containing protein [Streptomyces sp. NPDC051132]|uniref:MmyB family transcriptional regulator n=1 Tax=unclassified Streptomyces TaxID=2593676 RepID=UPI00344ABA39
MPPSRADVCRRSLGQLSGVAAVTGSRPFQALLRLYRGRRSREDFGLPPRPSNVSGPRIAGLRQGDIDVLLDLGFGVFQRIESGAKRPSVRTFRRITDLLGFSETHLRIAHLDLFGMEPALTAGAPSDGWQQMVDRHGDMAIVIDTDGEVVAANSAFLEMISAAHQPPPQNWWQWALLGQAARDISLLQWEATWAPRLMTDFVLAGVRNPHSRTLAALRQAIQDDPATQHLVVADSGIDRQTLPFRHGQRGEGAVYPLLATAPSVTLITLPFTPGGQDAAGDAAA